ncbi:MAG TPA: TlpA disulfide reductase family protein [Vicinamibacteria bacterium]|nr:TlpA disulfide reductase family protein [Vicinamibacteria bacterium]
MASPAPTATAPAGARLNRVALGLGLAVVMPLLVILVLNLGRDPHAVRSPLIGRPAPAFALTPVGGGPPVTLESLRGKPVVLNFWATWCVPCFQEHPALIAAARRLGGDVQFLGVVYDDEEGKVQSFLAQRGQAYPSLMDDGARAAIAYGVAGVPETYFIDPTGKISAKYSLPLDFETIVQEVSQARAGAR